MSEFAATAIAPGLWRWSARHPDWTPRSAGHWDPDVGCVLYESAEAAVFFDPLAPNDSAGFWSWVDARQEGKRVVVLTTIRWHRRSRAEFVGRYGAATSRAKANLPPGVESFVVKQGGETIFWLPEPGALVPGDRILGAPRGGLRVCPDSWMTDLRHPLTESQLRERLRPLLELPIERVLVSHGEPVLSRGRAALARALAG